LKKKKEKGNYELLTGMHRLQAVQNLGHKTIKAVVFDSPHADLAKVHSFTENLVGKSIESAAASDVIAEDLRKYGSIKALSEQTGLTEGLINKCV